MSNGMYGKAKTSLCRGLIDWVTEDVRIMFVDSVHYTPDFDNDEFVSDVPENGRFIVPDSTLPNKTVTLGACDADDMVLNNITVDNAVAIVLFIYTGDYSTSKLLCYIDDASNLPLTCTDERIILQWPSGEDKIFSI